MGKNHNQEVRSLMLKNKALSNEAEDLRNASQRLHAQLKVEIYLIHALYISVVDVEALLLLIIITSIFDNTGNCISAILYSTIGKGA